MALYTRICAALTPLILLSACLLTPGKFDSSLDIRKDGTFTFTYRGEVLAQDMASSSDASGETVKDETSDDADAPDSTHAAGKDEVAGKDAAKAAKLQEIADALLKEKGFRSARYMGGDTIEIDYAISGRLDHSFIFPFNIDAKAVFPFVAVEVRTDGKVRVQAPAFGDDSGKPGDMTGAMTGGMGDDGGAKGREGTFTLTTDAEVVSQNQEDGATATPQGKRIVWKITPTTKVTPTAVLKLAGGR